MSVRKKKITRFHSIHFYTWIKMDIFQWFTRTSESVLLTCSSSDQWKILRKNKEKVATGGVSISNRKNSGICIGVFFIHNKKYIIFQFTFLFLVKIGWHLITAFKINLLKIYIFLTNLQQFTLTFYIFRTCYRLYFHITSTSVLRISERRHLKDFT